MAVGSAHRSWPPWRDEGSTRPRVEAWFAANVGEVELPLELRADLRRALEPHLRGHATRPDSRWALRRPPLGKRLASAHDMGREHRIIAALQDTAVPVPPVVGALRGRVGERRALLRHGLRRGPDPAVTEPRPRRASTRPSGARSASASSTRWSRSTRSIPTRSASASWAARRTTSPASSSAGTGQWEKSKTRELPAGRRGPRPARPPGFPSRARRRSSTATTGSTT